MSKKRKNKIKRICGNCKLYDPGLGECSVVIIHEGRRHRIPVDPEDKCFFEEPYFDPTTNAIDNFVDDIKQVRFWVEDELGRKTEKNGRVKMEYPEGFFGAFPEGFDESPLGKKPNHPNGKINEPHKDNNHPDAQ